MNCRVWLGLLMLGMLAYTSGCSTDNQPPTPAASVPQVAPSISPEETFWDETTELPFSIQKMEEYLQKYPQGVHSSEATQIIQDEATMDQIERQGAGDRFIIPSEAMPEFFTSARETNTERGRTVFEQGRGGIIYAKTVFGNLMIHMTAGQILSYTSPLVPLVPCGPRSVFVIKGKYENIIGDTNDPIRIAYLDKIGLVVIGGKGRVLDPRDQTIYTSWDK